MGWDGPVTHRQHKVWLEWLSPDSEAKGTPDPHALSQEDIDRLQVKMSKERALAAVGLGPDGKPLEKTNVK